MKKTTILAVLLVVMLAFSACGAAETENNDNTDRSGENTVTDRDGDVMEIDSYEDEVVSNITEVPDWAEDLGLSTPKGMTLDTELSVESKEKDNGYNAFTLVYSGDYDVAMAEAERIAEDADIAVSSELQDLTDEAFSMMDMPEFDELPEDMQAEFEEIHKGAIYSNFGILSGELLEDDAEYQIAIIVDPDGVLSIVAIDYEKMMETGMMDMFMEDDYEMDYL